MHPRYSPAARVAKSRSAPIQMKAVFGRESFGRTKYPVRNMSTALWQAGHWSTSSSIGRKQNGHSFTLRDDNRAARSKGAY